MIVDAFCLNNELSVLEIRLATLDSVVDKFVLVEAELTQSLLPKPLYFEENKEKFTPWLDKIVHVKIKTEECPDNDEHLWAMENFTRNQISKGLSQIDLSDDDIVCIGDLDEIVKPEILEKVVYRPDKSPRLDNMVAFEGFFNAYFLNLHAFEKTWVGTVACPFWMLQSLTPQMVRQNKDYVTRIEDAGWHFSYCNGGWEGVFNKYLATIEPFNKNLLIQNREEFKQFFQKRVLQDKRFIYADRRDDVSVRLTELPFTELPQCIQANRTKFEHMLFKEGMVI